MIDRAVETALHNSGHKAINDVVVILAAATHDVAVAELKNKFLYKPQIVWMSKASWKFNISVN